MQRERGSGMEWVVRNGYGFPCMVGMGVKTGMGMWYEND